VLVELFSRAIGLRNGSHASSVCLPACAGECLFLFIALYLCYCIRSAPSFYFETKLITFAILNELLFSALYYVVRYVQPTGWPPKCFPPPNAMNPLLVIIDVVLTVHVA